MLNTSLRAFLRPNHSPIYAGSLLFMALFWNACASEPIEEPFDPGTGFPLVIAANLDADTLLVDHNHADGGVDYVVTTCIRIGNGRTLRVAPGTRIAFSTGACLEIQDSAVLQAVGTAESPIVFTGESPVPGHWGGLHWYYSPSPDNRLEHCVIEHTGAPIGPYAPRGAINLDLASFVDVRRCTLRHASGPGVYVWFQWLSRPLFLENRIHDCEIPFVLCANRPDLAHPSNTMTGNLNDYVLILGQGNGTRVDDSTHLAKLDVPYAINEALVVHAPLRIDPGVELIFRANAQIWFNYNARLHAVGTPQQPIVFRGEQSQRGYWTGLHVTDGAQLFLRHCVVADAGRAAWFASPEGAVMAVGDFAPSVLDIADCTFLNGSSNAVTMAANTLLNPDFSVRNDFSGLLPGFQAVVVF